MKNHSYSKNKFIKKIGGSLAFILALAILICAFAANMGVLFLDHFIVAGNSFSSVQKESYMDLYLDSKRRR